MKKNEEKQDDLEKNLEEIIEPRSNDRIKELEEKIAELTTGWQRTQADFINFKNQTEKDRSRIIKIACSSIIEELLPVLDNFALASKHIPSELADNNWVIGIKQIEKQFESILSNEGLERIETLGYLFDPELHEAVEEIKSDKPEHEIIEEVAPGYKLNGTILRPAKVKISSGA